MHIVEKYPDGVFSWVDLSTNDTEGAKAFYSGLFGWEADDQPAGDSMVYTMNKLGGYDVSGLGAMSQEMIDSGMPPVWTSYVNHSDVDAVAEKVTAAGGTVVMPPMDITTAGRMALFQDPTGAIFGVWQAGDHKGAQLVNQPNTLVWNELQTNDVGAATAFYEKALDWGHQTDDNGYVGCLAGDRMQAGMMAIQPEWGEVPPNWAVYFMVDDVEATVARATELGGNVIVPPTPAGDIGVFATLQDPQGGMFNVIKLAGPVDTPPGS